MSLLLALSNLTLTAQINIFQKLSGNENWGLMGKCENGFIYQKRGKKDKWGVIGKYENGLIFQKNAQKDSWGVVGKYDDCHGEAAFLLLILNQGN